MDAISLLTDFINIHTEQPRPDYPAAVAFLKRVCAEKLPGCHFEVHEYVSGKPNLVVKLAGESCRAIVLSCHMDVVPVVADADAQPARDRSAPEPSSDSTNIVGRGSQDMKSIGIAYIEALSRMQRPLKKSIHLVFTVDEEIGSKHGMQALVEHGVFQDTAIDIVLDEGAPSPFPFLVVFNQERFAFPVQITVSGHGGHGSTFVHDSAAEKLTIILSRIRDFRRLQMGKMKDLLDLGNVITANVDVIRGGVQVNVVPTSLELQADLRVPPGVGVGAIEGIVDGWVDGLAGVQWTRLVPDDRGCDRFTSLDNRYLQVLQQVLKDDFQVDSRVAVFPGATDSRFLRAAGCDALNISPFRNTPILLHDKDEHLPAAAFAEAIDIYQRTIAAFCEL